MSQLQSRIKKWGLWMWKRLSVAIAMAFILLALFVGIRVGHGLGGGGKVVVQGGDTEGAVVEKQQFYTCSMHPQIRMTDPNGKCPICFMDLIPVKDSASTGSQDERKLRLGENAIRLAEVETTVVSRFVPTAEVRLYGTVSYDQTRVARINAYFPGRLDRLYVDYVGIPIQRGDHIAEIYSPELLAAFEELRQAKQAVELNPSASDLIRSTTVQTLDAARERLRLLGITPEQIVQVESDGKLPDTFTVFSPMKGVVTERAVREGDYVKTGDEIVTVADLSRLWLELEAYESDLPLLRWGQDVEFTVHAQPGRVFHGRISFIEPLVDSMTRAANVRVAVDNAEGLLKPGMFASTVVYARVTEQGVVGDMDLANKWVCLMHPEEVYEEAGECRVCGMNLVQADVLFESNVVDEGAKPLVVPRSAVLKTGRRAVVYVKLEEDGQPVFEGREVMLGVRAGDFYIVVQGLEEGEKVVTNGAFKIDSAMQILAKPSMMMPQGGGSGGGHDHGNMGGKSARVAEKDTGVDFASRLSDVYETYLGIQEALAADDLAKYQELTVTMDEAVGAVKMAGLDNPSMGLWHNAMKLLKEQQTEDIEDARVRFRGMSDAMLDLTKKFGRGDGDTWYVAHCPMAFDFEGADWIQRQKEISNPYMGSEMPRCGEIRQELKSANAGKGASDE